MSCSIDPDIWWLASKIFVATETDVLLRSQIVLSKNTTDKEKILVFVELSSISCANLHKHKDLIYSIRKKILFDAKICLIF